MKKIETSELNPFEYFNTAKEVREFMQDAFEDEDPRVFISALSDWVKHHGVAEVAASANINRESLYKTINGKTTPTWPTVHKLWSVLRRNCAI